MIVDTPRRNFVYSSVVSHFAALEKLRRVIFTSTKRQTASLAVAFLITLAGTSSSFAQTTEGGLFPFGSNADASIGNSSASVQTITNGVFGLDPTSDVTVGQNDRLYIFNDEYDLKAPNNDASKTITLDGGWLNYFTIFDENVDYDLLLGEGSKAKNFEWGSGGVINVLDPQITLGLRRSGVGAEIYKIGAGTVQFMTTDDDANNEHRFGSTYVADGNVSYCSASSNLTKTTFDGDFVLYYDEYVDETTGEISLGIGRANFLGDVAFNGGVQLSYSNSLVLYDGDVVFEGNAYNMNGSVIGLKVSGNNGASSVVFNGFYDAKRQSFYCPDSNSTTTFNSAVELQSGSKILGDYNARLIFNDDVTCDSSSTVLVRGDAMFAGVTFLTNDSYLFIDEGTTDVKGDIVLSDSHIQVDKEAALNVGPNVLFGLTQSKSYARFFGAVNFVGADIVVKNGATFAAGSGVKFLDSIDETTGETKKTTLTVASGADVDGYASTVGKVDIRFVSTGGLIYSDLLAKHNVTDVEIEPVKNPVYYTLDELKERTYLVGSGVRCSIMDALATNQIVDHKLVSEESGDGEIYVHSYLQTSLEEYQPGQVAGYNGYAVVFNDPNNDELFTKYSGFSEVVFGTAILQGGTVYGAGTEDGKFVVCGQSYTKDEEETQKWGQNIYRTETSGVLAFYRGDEKDANVAPTLQAHSVCFENGYKENDDSESILGGARIWLDASYSDSTSDRKLGTINADAILFGDQTQIYYDQISTVDSSANLTFDLNANHIKYNSVEVEATQEDIERIFGGAQLVDASYQTNVEGLGTVTIKPLDAADYAASKDMTQKERDYAAKLDANRITVNSDTPFFDALYNETDEGKVRQTIHNLSIGGYQMLNSYGHFGNPTSSFFGGSTISGEHKRAQSIEPEYDPLEERDRQAERQSVVANAPVDDASRAIWGAYTNTTVEGDEYNDDGITTNGYRLRRQGIVGGLKRQFDGTTSGGLFFGLSNPEISSNGKIQGGYGNYGSHMEMDDFQFAGHFEKVVGDFWEIAAYVGGGTQSMDWRRELYLTEGGRYRFEADGSGNTLTGTLYLANRIDLNENATFRPTIGVDSEHSWLYGFNEIQTVGGTNDEVNAYMRWLAQSYAYDQTYYNRNTARAGARFNWSGSAGIAGLNAQAFYAVKLGGKDAPLVSYRSENYSFDNMETHVMGNESFSVGGGGFVNLNRKKTLTATGDFNAVWYKNATTQNVTGGLTYRF